MKFIAKAILQQILSYLPKSESWNYFFQRNVTRNLPRSDEIFFNKVTDANSYLNAFRKYCPETDIKDAHFFEFGTGWDLIIPLAYYYFGIQRQTLIDIRPNLRLELINNTISRFSQHKAKLEKDYSRQFQIEPAEITNIPELFDRFGIQWLAPVDAKKTPFSANSFDFISNSVTLEHISENKIVKILKECYRILKPEGIMSCIVDMKDHYSYFDKKVSPYNFLKYSDKTWALLNPPLQFQNRLRYPDYINFFKQAGFEILEEDVIRPSVTDIEFLKNLPLAYRFKNKYTLEELGVKSFWIALKKKINFKR